MLLDQLKLRFKKPPHDPRYRTFWQFIHIDIVLLFFLMLLCSVGLFILYSASNQNPRAIQFQVLHFLFAFAVMFVIAQIPPSSFQRSAPWLYTVAILLLLTVLIIGHIGKGAQRWLNFGFLRFQPSELMKITVPLLLAWYYHRCTLPITVRSLMTTIPLILVPAFLVAKQPDLSTATLLTIAGLSVLFLAGLSGRIILITIIFAALVIPFGWFFLHDYQRLRIFTFLNPERDPLSSGYHIIQSKIAIGSGGMFGKGWLNGTQSNLQFLPEHSTDFIFAVCGEEFGFVGVLILITLFMFVVIRGIYITVNAQDTFSRLLAGSITFTFFVSFFINMGMVTGILPVMGIPLPLVSYGGSSMVTIMASFGMLMSIQTHRKLLST